MEWKLKNPANVLLPVFLFVVLENFYGVNIAGSISLFVAFLFFLYWCIRKTLNWCMLPILFIVATATFIMKSVNVGEFNVIMSEIIILFFALVFFLFRKPITKIMLSKFGKRAVGVQENLNLFFITLSFTSLIFVIYILSFFIERYFSNDLSHYLFAKEELVLLFILWSYMTIKVYILRTYLSKEEYWPILNEAGGVIGYESREHVYFSKEIKNPLKKNFHPVIRILLIFDNKLFFKKNDSTDFYYPGKWDISISGHLLYGETYEDCVGRLLKKNYNIEENHTQYLLKYTYENSYECQRVFLNYMYVSNIIMQNADLSNVKPWTIAQVLDELDSNIFTDKLKKEITLLKELSFPHLFNREKNS